MSSWIGSLVHGIASWVVGILLVTGLATTPTAGTVAPIATSTVATTTVISAPLTTTPAPTTPTPEKQQATQNNAAAQTVTQPITDTTYTTPSGTVISATGNIVSSPVTPASTVNSAPQAATITVVPDTLGIVSAGLDAFYNISSDANSEVDIKTLTVSIAGVQVTSGMVVSVNDATDNQILMASSQETTYNPDTNTLVINAVLNRPLRVLSGYPTMFEIKATNVSPFVNGPTITIESVGSEFIFKPTGPTFLKNSLQAEAEAYYLVNHSCDGLQGQGDIYSDCVSYLYNQ